MSLVARRKGKEDGHGKEKLRESLARQIPRID